MKVVLNLLYYKYCSAEFTDFSDVEFVELPFAEKIFLANTVRRVDFLSKPCTSEAPRMLKALAFIAALEKQADEKCKLTLITYSGWKHERMQNVYRGFGRELAQKRSLITPSPSHTRRKRGVAPRAGSVTVPDKFDGSRLFISYLDLLFLTNFRIATINQGVPTRNFGFSMAMNKDLLLFSTR